MLRTLRTVYAMTPVTPTPTTITRPYEAVLAFSLKRIGYKLYDTTYIYSKYMYVLF